METVVMDALDPDQVAAACEGVGAVYYLIHGMGGEDFAETDREAATNFAAGVRAQAVTRIVYLSGLVPDVGESELSEHIRSRRDVEQILSDVPATVVVLRAAVLLGSGSTSFEIIRQVSERMPVHTVPSWMDSMVQPIAVVDALAREQVGDAHVPGEAGGPQRLAVGDGVEHDFDVVVAGVLGQVKAEGLQPRLVSTRRGVNSDQSGREQTSYLCRVALCR